jgi:hypothetical protein
MNVSGTSLTQQNNIIFFVKSVTFINSKMFCASDRQKAQKKNIFKEIKSKKKKIKKVNVLFVRLCLVFSEGKQEIRKEKKTCGSRSRGLRRVEAQKGL